MGYDLHITRSTDWSENAGHEISSNEWLTVVGSDPELLVDPDHGPFAVRWSSTFFDWADGNVFTTNPDRATVAKALSLAQRLEGLVQGDDGEIYHSPRQWPPASRSSS